MTTSTTTRKIPTPLYAAAGAGDLAYEQLRKLPAQVAQLRSRVEELRPAVAGAVAETNLRADLDRLRGVARRNASTFLSTAQAGAQTAQDRAVAVYTELVTRGEKVVAGTRAAEAKVEIEPAAKTVTVGAVVKPAVEPAAEIEAAPPATPNTHAAKKTLPAKKDAAKK